MDFHPGLKDNILIQSGEEGESWQTSNYSLIRICGDMLRFHDFEGTLIQEFPYTIDDQANILIKPDLAPFGKILQQSSERLLIEQPDAKRLHFTKVPDTTLNITNPDIENLLENGRWSTQQLGVQLSFTYITDHCLQQFKKNTGIPEIRSDQDVEFQFTIVRPFGKWFLLMFADQTMVEALPVHMLSDEKIEVYASLLPPTIRVLTRVG